MIRFGSCISHRDTAKLKILAALGFDYAELGLSSMRGADDAEIAAFAEAARECGIGCEAVNVMFPGDIRLTGEAADHAAAKEYLSAVLAKTKPLAFKTVVFGSGGARRMPDGYPREKAKEQLISLVRGIIMPFAEQYDFTVCLEELNSNETNILNTLGECEEYLDAVNNPRFAVVADIYHIALEGTPAAKIAAMGSRIKHCHISSAARKYPHSFDPPESVALCRDFFGALRDAGYDGKMSIEAGMGTLPVAEGMSGDEIFAAESKASLEFLRSLRG